MTQSSRQSVTKITFYGVEVSLPPNLPFSQQDGCLMLDISPGYTGRVVIKPSSTCLASPAQHAAQGGEQQPFQSLALRHASLDQLSQPGALSQGSYPPWLLQSAIPDSVDPQSPFRQKERQTQNQDQPADVTLQQQEAHKRNAAALQELMTQADPSEPEADDYVADTAADGHMDLDDSVAMAQQSQPAAAAAAAALSHRAGGDPSVATEVYGAAVPAEAAVPGSKANSGRGAGTPAGPSDEFYSPPEHFNGDAAEHRDSIMQAAAEVPKMNSAAQRTADASDKAEALQPSAAQADVSAEPVIEAQQAALDDAQQPEALPEGMTAGAEQQAATSTAKTPMPAKTPANPKRRKGTKSVPPSSKRRKATPAALTEGSFAWKALDNEWGAESLGPSERWGASLTCIDDSKICLMGGADGDGAQLDDAWVLDLSASGWTKLPGAALPSVRAWHSAQMVHTDKGEQLVVFGGEYYPEADENQTANTAGGDDDDTVAEVSNELCLLEPDMKLWVTVDITGKGGKGPPGRTGHSCTVLPDGRLLVFGGLADNGKFMNDMFVIDVKRLTWFKMTAKGAPPKGRAYHSATMVGDRIVFMGGQGSNERAWSLKEVYTLNTETWKWTEHTSEVEGESPSPRFGHCAIALPDNRHLATFGGCDQREDMFFSSVAVLDTLTWRWNTPKIQGMMRPPGRSGHGMVSVKLSDSKDGLVVFGGRSKNDLLHNDTWLLELPDLSE